MSLWSYHTQSHTYLTTEYRRLEKGTTLHHMSTCIEPTYQTYIQCSLQDYEASLKLMMPLYVVVLNHQFPADPIQSRCTTPIDKHIPSTTGLIQPEFRCRIIAPKYITRTASPRSHFSFQKVWLYTILPSLTEACGERESKVQRVRIYEKEKKEKKKVVKPTTESGIGAQRSPMSKVGVRTHIRIWRKRWSNVKKIVSSSDTDHIYTHLHT